MKCAVIDIGSNTIKCSLFRRSHGVLKLSGYASETVRLLGYVSDAALSDEGLTLLCRALESHRQYAKRKGYDNVSAFATASLRSLRNPDEIIAEVRSRTGIDIRIISGKEEAMLSFEGVCATEKHISAKGAVIDMGGGSTEVVLFSDRKPYYSHSFAFGALFLKGKFTLPGGAGAIDSDRLVCYCNQTTASLRHPEPGVCDEVYLVGGTAKAAAHIHFAQAGVAYPSGPVLSFEEFDALTNSILGMSPGDSLDLTVRRMYPDRYNMILPGLLALRVLLKKLNCSRIHIAAGGLREGVAMRLFSEIR